MSESVSDQRDEALVLHINDWLNSSVLPPNCNDLDRWDIYETVHEDEISIVEVGSTVYNTAVNDFLEDEDDDLKDDDPSNKMKLQSIKMEQLRIVFDFSKFEPPANSSKTSTAPPVLAIYNKRNNRWQQVFAVKSFADPEIDTLCSSESMMDDVEQTDLSLLFESLSKKQLILGIQSFFKKIGISKANTLKKKIPELKDLNVLMEGDQEFIQIAIAQIVSQSADILDEFNSVIDRDLENLVNEQFQQNLRDLQKDIFEDAAWDEVLDDIKEIVKKAKSFSDLGQHLDALSLVESVCKQFLIDFVAEIEDEDREELRLDRNLEFCISDLESAMERICKKINIKLDESLRERLKELEGNMKEWREKLTNVFGPVFSDNIRALSKKLEESSKRKRDDDQKLDGDGERASKRQKVR